MGVSIFVGDKQMYVPLNWWGGFKEWVYEHAPDYESWKFAIDLVLPQDDIIQSYVVNDHLPDLKKQLQEVRAGIDEKYYEMVDDLIKMVDYGIENNYHFGVERTQEEIEVYEGEDKTPKNARGWNNKGDALYALDRYDEAVECYIKTIELDPEATETEAWNDLDSLIGHTLKNLGMYDKMIEYCDRLLKLDPGKADIWYNKAEALWWLERYGEADKCYEKAMKLSDKYKYCKKFKPVKEEGKTVKKNEGKRGR